MPLYLISHYEGFVGYKRRTRNVREARVFTSFEEADEFAKDIPLTVYAILQTPENNISLADELRNQHGHWEEHPNFPILDWKYDVTNNYTRLGYWAWVANCITSNMNPGGEDGND